MLYYRMKDNQVNRAIAIFFCSCKYTSEGENPEIAGAVTCPWLPIFAAYGF